MLINKFIDKFPEGDLKDELLRTIIGYVGNLVEKRFYVACEHECIEEINQFLEYGYPLDKIDSVEGYSPLLHYALYNRNIEMLLLYIHVGGTLDNDNFEKICENCSFDFVKQIVDEFYVDSDFLEMVKNGIKSASKTENHKVMLFLFTILAQNNRDTLEMISEVFK
jgi:hypothetical protein